MSPNVDLDSLLVVLRYAQAIQDGVSVELESVLTDQARDLLVQMELAAPLN
ncbi:MAG: hypothetical protein KF878_08120 [Planctomycetes bacterium]|nr:hypothetical protein [Planctomycetota bacterium]